MADEVIKISELPNSSPLDGTELVPVVKDGVTSQTTIQDIVDLGGGSGTSLTDTITAGENLVENDLVYLKSDGKYWKADYLTTATCSTELRLVTDATITADASGESLAIGLKDGFSGLTAGELYYVAADGAICLYSDIPDTEGIIVRSVGTAKSTTELEFNPDETYIETTLIPTGQTYTNLIIVESVNNLPDAVGDVITLVANTTYFITNTLDLNGKRLVCGANTTLIGGSSENCRIKSTGLVGDALITSVYSLPIRNLTIEAAIALDLDGDGTTTALDWFGVNFTDCAVIGTIKDYSNFIMADSAFLNSGGLTFDGTIGTIGFSQCLFDCNSANTAFILPATLTITRRFRIIYSSFVVLSGETGINVNASATIPSESYILDTVNFSGGGTYLTGIDHTSNDSLFSNCTNITNTAVNGQLYMQSNATATTVGVIDTFYKIAGTTTASADNAKFSHSDNRLTCDAVINRKYLIQATLSFTTSANNVCEFGFYDSQLAGIRTPSRTKSTANTGGRAENVTLFCIVNMDNADYIEVHCANKTGANNITVDNLNFIVTEIR
jgi:hypothetical protein